MSRWLVGIPMWGSRAVNTFLDVGLPHHIAALAGFPHDVTYVIHTDQMGTVSRGTSKLPARVEVREIATDSAYEKFGFCHGSVLEMARPGDRVSLLCADQIISREFFHSMQRRLDGGYKAIVGSGLRTTGANPPAPGVSSEDLNRWAVANMHPIVERLVWGTGRGAVPWLLLFRRMDSVVMHAFHLHPFAVIKQHGQRFTETIDRDLLANFKQKEIHVVTDRLELATAEISEPEKTHGEFPRPLSARLVAMWASINADPMHRWLFEHAIRLTGTEDCGDAQVCADILKQLKSDESDMLDIWRQRGRVGQTHGHG